MLQLLAAVFLMIAPPAATSEWVRPGPDGRLVYKTTERDDRIMDFSYAGYGGGGVAIPDVPVKREVKPTGGEDDSATIQRAIDDVSKLPIVDGFCGAVLLSSGTFNCSAPITIRTSGVVVRGSGSEEHGTTLKMTGSPHVCLSLGAGGRGAETQAKTIGQPIAITVDYIPCGTTSFNVADASSLKPGDVIRITKPITPAWVHFMGMDTLVRNGRAQTWLSGEMHAERRVEAISGNRIMLDVPLSDSYDARYLSPPGVIVTKLDASEATVTNVGAESFRILSPAQSIGISDPQHQAARINGVCDGWLRDIDVADTINSVAVGATSRRITIQRVRIRHTVPSKGAAKPADFASNASQTLFDRCDSSGDNLFYFGTGARAIGPIVLLNCTFSGDGHVQPHQRWATGLLLDNCKLKTSSIDLMNRGIYGSGHGWTIGWSVAWNCTAKTFLIQQPPGSINWSIGCRGEQIKAPMPGGDEKTMMPQGVIDSPGAPVEPASLYLAQLKDRVGAQGAKNLGY